MQKLIGIFFLFAGSFLSDSAFASERLLASDGKKADIFIDDNYQCEDVVKIKVKANSAGYFDQRAEQLQKKISATSSAIIGFECPKNSKILIEGFTQGVLVFKADAAQKNKWSIQTEPAPLEKIALFASLQEPSFSLLGSLYDQLKPYRSINGVLTSYQFDAYEKQIHRVLSVVDGNIESFREYLLQPKGNTEFDEVLSHYSDILAIIKEYDPDNYGAYEQAYAEASQSLKDKYWQARIDEILENEGAISTVIAKTTALGNSSKHTEFKEYIDAYLYQWFTEQEQFVKTDLENAPLYEVAWSADLLASIPDHVDDKTYPKSSVQLRNMSENLAPAIMERLNQLQTIAIDAIKSSGATYDDVNTVIETGFALANEFDEAGFTSDGRNLLSETVSYVNEILISDLPKFKEQLKKIELNAEKLTTLQHQLNIYNDLAADLSAFSQYKVVLDDFLNAQSGSVCTKILIDAGASEKDLVKTINYGDNSRTLSSFACELYENDHTISEFTWDWWSPRKYIISIKDASGFENRFELEGNKFLFADELTIVKHLTEDEQSAFDSKGWDEYISKLIIPPPNGIPDKNGIRECDYLAADPFDPNKLAKGVDFSSDSFGQGDNDYENFDRAIDACIVAVEHVHKHESDKIALQEYQLGRLFWYSGEQELAKDYITSAADKGYAPALYYQAQLLLSTSEEQNDFVDALEMFEKSGKNGYARASVMLKELNPDGIKFFKTIPAPTSSDIVGALGNSHNKSVSMFGMTTYVRLTGVNIKECFQTSATDFSCEYKKVLDCGMSGGGAVGGLMSMALQSDCNTVYESFDNFRKHPSGRWEKL